MTVGKRRDPEIAPTMTGKRRDYVCQCFAESVDVIIVKGLSTKEE